MKNLLFLFCLLCTCLIISCSDQSEPLINSEIAKEIPLSRISSTAASPYECLEGIGVCSESGTSFVLANLPLPAGTGQYDLSDCLSPTPSGTCTVTGSLDVFWCGNQILIMEPQDIQLPDCGADAWYIDWDCVREKIVEQVEPWLWEYYLQTADIWPACHIGDEIYSTTLYRNTCMTTCTSSWPFPQSRLVDCGNGNACCYKINYWCDQGEGLQIYDSEVGEFGFCGEPEEVPTTKGGCVLDGPCAQRACLQ